MRMRYIFFIFCFTSIQLTAQPNCLAYKYAGDEKKYRACKAADKRAGHYQFSKAYQMALDDALAIDSSFSYAYRVKSTAYLKSGDFINWKKLIDLAVKYDPADHLDYRGWCRYQFFRDYEGAIADIERLDRLADYDIGHSVNADYHLHIARALCYKAQGEKEKAISIIKIQMSDKAHFVGKYDYLHLGVLLFEIGQYEEAIIALKKQEEENDIAENRYYLAMIYQATEQKEDFQSNMNMAKDKYLKGEKMFETYTEHMDKIYLEDIERQLGQNSNSKTVEQE